MGLFAEAVKVLDRVLAVRPAELGILTALAECYFSLGREEFEAGFFSRSEGSFSRAICIASQILQISSGFGQLTWKTIADALHELSKIATLTDLAIMAPAVQIVCDLLSKSTLLPAKILDRPLSDIMKAVIDEPNGRTIGWLAVVAYVMRMSLCIDDDDEGKACARYDLSMSVFSLLSHGATESGVAALIHREANQSLRTALQIDPSNDRYWNALGSLNFDVTPKIAQHSFVRALELDPKVGGIRFTDVVVLVTLTSCASRIPCTGQTWLSSIYTMAIQSWQMMLCAKPRYSILNIVLHGSAKRW
jgi:superkiller protein 3